MAPNDIPSWSSLKGQAADGQLTLKEGAIEELVSACDASIGRLLALKAYIDQMNNVKAFAPSLGSSNTLAQKYVTSANTLGDILKAHLDIHYDLADTLIAARRAYIKAELAGKEEFDQLGRLAKIPPRTTKPGSFHSDPSQVES